MSTLAELRGVWKRYGRVPALQGVSMRITQGESVGLVGPNGAGKSTLLSLLTGCALPSEGEVALPPEGSVSGILDRSGFHPDATVRQCLLAQANVVSVGRDAVEKAMALCGLAAHARKRIRQLSTGLRQRVGWAAAILRWPALLVLDEPTSGLDPEGVRDLQGVVGAARDRGTAVLISSHRLDELSRSVDRIVFLRNGTLVYDGPVPRGNRVGLSLRGRAASDAPAILSEHGFVVDQDDGDRRLWVRLDDGTQVEDALQVLAGQGIYPYEVREDSGPEALEALYFGRNSG